MDYVSQIEEAAEYLKSQLSGPPKIGIISGTGISLPEFRLDEQETIPFKEIPGFLSPTVSSHSGEFIKGTLDGHAIAWFKGRHHYYEGLSMRQVAFPARVFAALGGDLLIVINAAGGVNPDFQEGDLALITDHINFMQDNPLIGENDERLGPRFPDMSEVYDLSARDLLGGASRELSIECKEGVYLALPGPSLETRAEYDMIRRMGADLVGMSTVPEVIAARHNGLRVVGISIVTNVVRPGEPLQKTTIEEVIETADRASQKLGPLLRRFVGKL